MPGPEGGLPRWIGALVTVVAPASLLSAVLFYFGYVSARAQYEYFGVDVDTIGLGTRDYVMRSPQPLLVPLLVLTLLGAGMLVAHAAVRERLAAATAAGRALRATRAAGLVLLGAGILLMLGYPVAGEWAYYPLVTPLLLGTGGGLVAYTARLFDLVRRAAPASGPSGQGRNLDRLPRVILDTRERLYLRDPVVQETALETSEGQTFRYRYRRLRLLIVGKDRMFLVPERWSASNSTLVVPLDGSARVQFQFQNQPP
ncbi:hypothetical protein K1W54_41470 [Micromonospora sp. CPCC 205371]|nr:hypothetical protein [Micromonospora sp. CPCC 205371]